jgi:hypothetical protein
LLSVSLFTGVRNLPVQFDEAVLNTGSDGRLTLNATVGQHTVIVPAVVGLTDASRLVFEQWNETIGDPALDLELSEDICLYAIYRPQHYLAVASLYGSTVGAGWYDENETARFCVTRPILTANEKTYVFTEWSGDKTNASPASSILMDEPKSVSASWVEVEEYDFDSAVMQAQVLFLMACVALAASMFFAWRTLRSGGRIKDAPRSSTGRATETSIHQEQHDADRCETLRRNIFWFWKP